MSWHAYADQRASDERSFGDARPDHLGVAVFRVAWFPQEPGEHTLELYERDRSLASWDRSRAEEGDDTLIARLRCNVDGSGARARLVFPADAVSDNDFDGEADSGKRFTLRIHPRRGSDEAEFELKLPAAALAGEDDPWAEIGLLTPGQTWGSGDRRSNVPVLLVERRYGGYDLRREDRDRGHRYAGRARRGPSEAVPGRGETGYVAQLQRDLRALGFALTPQSGSFDLHTEWAVREFQISASMARVAQEAEGADAPRYVDRLSQVENDRRYAGPISGVANRATRTLIQHWLSQRWRCPLVLEAWRVRSVDDATGRPQYERVGDRPAHENVWLHNEVRGPLRVFATDFSGHYEADLPAGRPAHGPHVLGKRVGWRTFGGPVSLPPEMTWASSEMNPEPLVGSDYAGLSEVERSTFRVVRAVAEKECIGYFDCINAYDNAFLSLGPCHWTLGIVHGRRVSNGELCGFLAYLAWENEYAFDHCFGRFGARVSRSWIDAEGHPTGARLFSSSPRKYAGWLELQGEQPNGRLSPSREDASWVAVAKSTDAEGNWFKSWPWFYRFAMAGRTSAGWRSAMWNMARIRLRDILSAPGLTWRGRDLTVAEVFTSELAVAIALRWHIRAPGHIVARGQAGRILRNALRTASQRGSWAADPADWTDANERELCDAMIAAAAGYAVRASVPALRNWRRGHDAGTDPRRNRRFRWDPTPPVSLSEARGSFQFAADPPLPRAPYVPAPAAPAPSAPAPAAPASPAPAPAAPAPTVPATPASGEPGPGSSTPAAAGAANRYAWGEIVVIGDSQSQGLRLAAARASRQRRELRALTVHDHHGKRADWILNHCWSREIPSPLHARMVLVMCGGNDISSRRWPSTRIQGYMTGIVERIREVNEGARVVFATVPVRGRFLQQDAFRRSRIPVLAELNDWIEGGGGARFDVFDVNAFIADASDPTVQAREYRRGRVDVHLNNSGYDRVLQELEQAWVRSSGT